MVIMSGDQMVHQIRRLKYLSLLVSISKKRRIIAKDNNYSITIPRECTDETVRETPASPPPLWLGYCVLCVTEQNACLNVKCNLTLEHTINCTTCWNGFYIRNKFLVPDLTTAVAGMSLDRKLWVLLKSVSYRRK